MFAEDSYPKQNSNKAQMNTTSKTILGLLGALSGTGAVKNPGYGSTTEQGLLGTLPNDGSAEICPNFLGNINNRDWKANEWFETPEVANKMYWWAK